MKKYVDWDKVEEESVSAEEACECTRSKLQSLIDFVLDLFPKKKESSFCAEMSATENCCDEMNQTDKGQCNDN